MRYKYILILFITLSASLVLDGQQKLSDQLKLRLENKEKLYEIMEEVDKFYAGLSAEQKTGPSFDIPKLKHWKRWEWYQSSRLSDDGSFANINDAYLKAIKSKKKTKALSSVHEGNWKSIGPSESSYGPDLNNSYANGTGRIDRIAFHPSDANTFYVGTPAGGLWKTIDGGTHWTALTDHIGSLGISGIVVDWNNPNNIYILTGDGDANITGGFVNRFGYLRSSVGILKSTDGGLNWSATGALPLSIGVTNYYGYALSQNPLFPNSIIAATSDGLFKTIDGGASWVKIKSGLHYDVKYNIQSVSVYATTSTGVYFSRDSGITWSNSNFNIAAGENGRKAIALTPADTGVVYVLCGGATGISQFSGLYKSTDSATNFTRQSNSPNILGYEIAGNDDQDQAIYDLCIAVPNNNSTTVITGGINLWRSTDSGTTMVNLTGWYETQGGNAYIHPDVHSLAYNLIDNKLYALSDGGIYVSSNNGNTWTNLSKGIQVSQIYHMDQYSPNPYQFALGLQDNGVKHRNKALEDFIHLYGADGFSPSFVADNANEFYATLNDVMIRINTTTGAVFHINPINHFFKVSLAHPTNPNIVFSGANNIYKSINKGNSWTNVGGAGNWTMAFAPSDTNRMYSAGSISFGNGAGTLYTSADAGDNWTAISGNPGFPVSFTKITDVAVSRFLPNEVYASFGGYTAAEKVYFSSDFGANWQNFSFNLPNIPINCIAVFDGGLYVGTDAGIYRRTFGTNIWVDISDNLPNVPITELFVDANAGKITAATFGRGVWELAYCVDNITLTASQMGVLDYSCNNMLNASTLIPAALTTNVSFKANNEVNLEPGFEIGINAQFNVVMAACTDPAMPSPNNQFNNPNEKGENRVHIESEK